MQIDINKKYQTRDGRAVRLLATDGPLPRGVVGIVGEDIYRWYASGLRYASTQDKSDLIESPLEIQVKGFLNIYKYDTAYSAYFHQTKPNADEAVDGKNRFACPPINLTVKEGEGL